MRVERDDSEEIIASRVGKLGFTFQTNPSGAPNGLYVITNWISESEEKAIVDFISKGQWSDAISGKRLTQHYGYRYTIDGNWKSEDKLPTDWGVLKDFATRIETQFPGIKIAQCLANLYLKDTGIAAHRDRETPLVFGISAVGDTNMVWSRIDDPKVKYEALIPARSLYIMSGDAAFLWKHEVPVRKRLKYPDVQGNLTASVDKPENYVRLSITFRHFPQGTGNIDRTATY